MKQYTKNLFFLGMMILMAVFMSCEDEKKISNDDIIGRWEVHKCERAGKPTQTLNGAYFEFMPQNKLATNILGDGVMTGYNIYNDVIVQQSGEKIRYKIEDLSESNMTLSAKIREVDFVLDLIKTSSL